MNDHDFEHLLAGVSRSFYLSLRILPKPVRNTLSLAYALARLSDTVADSTDAPAQRRIRALCALPDEWEPGWTASSPAEALLLDRAPELLQRLRTAPHRHEIERVWATIREGQIFDLARFPSPTPLSEAELDRYTQAVAGCVGEFWTEVCFSSLDQYSDAPPDEMLERGRAFGNALQLVNILRDRAADRRQGRIYVDDLQRALTRARGGLREGLAYAGRVRDPRLRLAVLLPARLGLRTLDLVEAAPDEARVKVPRREVWALFLMALPGLLPGRFSRLFAS